MEIQEFDVRTPDRDAMIDITDRVAALISETGLQKGVVTVYCPHTTAGITINENADPSVVRDLIRQLDEMVPWTRPYYTHGEGNSAAHVKSSLVGCSETIPFSGGTLTLGTWQGIYFCEFDGPRRRRVLVSIHGQ